MSKNSSSRSQPCADAQERSPGALHFDEVCELCDTAGRCTFACGLVIENPFARDRLEDVEPSVEAWARALCTAFGAKPDKLIGFPEAPAWRSWVGYAQLAIKASAILQSAQLLGAEGTDAAPLPGMNPETEVQSATAHQHEKKEG